MKKIIIVLSVILIQSALGPIATAQEKDTKNETWYVWVDTQVPIDNKMVNIVSKELMVITCCPKSGKYRKFVRKTAKWITENIAVDYDGELSLMKIQDIELASKTIGKLKEAEGVIIIDYMAVCK